MAIDANQKGIANISLSCLAFEGFGDIYAIIQLISTKTETKEWMGTTDWDLTSDSAHMKGVFSRQNYTTEASSDSAGNGSLNCEH